MAPTSRRQRFLSLVGRYLDQLYNHVRREIVYHTANGDLPQDSITVEDVVDEVIVRAWGEFSSATPTRGFRARLLQLAQEQLAAEMRRAREQAGRVVVGPDDDVEIDDEVLPLVDDVTPEQIVESHEMRRFIARRVAGMPREWRRIFVLHDIEELPLADVARVTGLSKTRVRQTLEQAHEYLRQRLIEAGVPPGHTAAGTSKRIFTTTDHVDVPDRYRTSLEQKIDATARHAGSGPRGEAINRWRSQ